MNQTRKLLQKIVENARTGADACDQMLSCAKDVDLRNELMNERDVYQDFTRDAERALFDSGAQPHASSPMSRAGMWIGVKTNTLADDSAAHLAEIIIQGATMGVIAITRARNDLPDASPAVQAVLSADTQESADEAVAALWESSLAWFDRSERPDVLALHQG